MTTALDKAIHYACLNGILSLTVVGCQGMDGGSGLGKTRRCRAQCWSGTSEWTSEWIVGVCLWWLIHKWSWTIFLGHTCTSGYGNSIHRFIWQNKRNKAHKPFIISVVFPMKKNYKSFWSLLLLRCSSSNLAWVLEEISTNIHQILQTLSDLSCYPH